MLNRSLYAVFLVFALLFLATMKMGPYPLDFLVKTIPILSLAVLAFSNISGSRGILIGVGLLFSGCGDVLLHIDGAAYFVHGLGSFLIAHLFYIAAFIRQPAVTRSRLPVLLAIGVYGVIMGALLLPHLGEMLIPVAAYLFIILAMGLSAALGAANPVPVIAGACLFILSDSMIAINRFLTPVPLSGYLIMMTYYAAQLLITVGSCHGAGRRTAARPAQTSNERK